VCIVNAIIFFDFHVPVAIHLLRSHIAVSGSSAMWEMRKSNSHVKMPSDYQTRAFFYPFPTTRISPVGAIGKLHTQVCWIGQLPLCGAGYFVFHGGGFFFSSL
jgi:hypothetical protein